jgi:hypothetical protein
MRTAIPQIDWKYLRSVQSELLSSLCNSINRKAIEILRSGKMSECDKYKALYQHMLHSDDTALTTLPFYVTSQIEGPLRQAILVLITNNVSH